MLARVALRGREPTELGEKDLHPSNKYQSYLSYQMIHCSAHQVIDGGSSRVKDSASDENIFIGRIVDWRKWAGLADNTLWMF
jgi:hypothetical protein